MSETSSLNTKAILLLTAPLIIGRGKSKEPAHLLTSGEYMRLASYLQEMGKEPADLLKADRDQVLGDRRHILDHNRLKRLLDRGFLLSQVIERWQTRAIWVISQDDDTYPQKLKVRLKKNSPSLLYGCGNREILNSGGLAIVGSRNVNDSLSEYTKEIGRLAAKARQTVVSGAARGIDRAAMSGALEAGGKVTGVLADSLEQTAMTREHRNLLLEGQLVLISPYDPNAGFNAGHAMQRNKVIYALSDAALVVNADMNKGGTWAGATEQLERLRLVPIYVRSTGEPSKGLEALKAKGAMPWPHSVDADNLDTVLRPDILKTSTPHTQSHLPFDARQELLKTEVQAGATSESPIAENQTLSPDEELYQTIRSLLTHILVKPKKATEVATELDVTKRQAEEWLKRLVAEGLLEKRTKPVSYVMRSDNLFSPKRAAESNADIEPVVYGK
ncbi:MAG: DNA-processing protein DprA [Nitrospira sp. SB0678_bin_10]|nr:DNA-processing protein DprA [Nitrospira sp. SB0678_bin_10]